MSPNPHANRLLASAQRVKAGGERFLGGVLPGASARRLQERAFADEWHAANREARHGTGPLWVVLGDSASQGIGATTRDTSYVGVVHEALRRRDARDRLITRHASRRRSASCTTPTRGG